VTWQRRPFPDANPASAGWASAGPGRQRICRPRRGHGRVDPRAGRAPRAGHQHPLARRPRRGQWAAAGGAPGSRPAPRTPRLLPAATRAAAKPSTSTSRSAPTPWMSRSTTGRSLASATPTGRSSARPGTPPATCRCGSRRSGWWWSGMRSRTTTSAGSTWPWMGRRWRPPPSPPCSDWPTWPLDVGEHVRVEGRMTRRWRRNSASRSGAVLAT
jgi:hypothetical protein